MVLYKRHKRYRNKNQNKNKNKNKNQNKNKNRNKDIGKQRKIVDSAGLYNETV